MNFRNLRPARFTTSSETFDGILDTGAERIVGDWFEPYFTFDQAEQVANWYNSQDLPQALPKLQMTFDPEQNAFIVPAGSVTISGPGEARWIEEWDESIWPAVTAGELTLYHAENWTWELVDFDGDPALSWYEED